MALFHRGCILLVFAGRAAQAQLRQGSEPRARRPAAEHPVYAGHGFLIRAALRRPAHRGGRKLNKISLVLAAVALLASSNLPAANELKVGFVSTERVFREAAP